MRLVTKGMKSLESVVFEVVSTEGMVIDFRFSGISAARTAKNTDSRSYECVEKSGIFVVQCVKTISGFRCNLLIYIPSPPHCVKLRHY